MIYFKVSKLVFLNICLWSKESNKVWNPISPETTKNYVYNTVALKKLDIRKWRAVISEREKVDEVSPVITPAHCFESFKLAVKGIQAELRCLLELSSWTWESEEAKQVRVYRSECQRVEGCLGRELGRCAPFPSSIHQSID